MAITTETEELVFKVARELDVCGIPSGERMPKARISAPAKIERPQDLAIYIEHTALKPEATKQAIVVLCDEAKRFGFRGVCVNPVFVDEAKRQLSGSGCIVVSVIGFPLGASLSDTKAQEARAATNNGADEVDMVIPLGALKSGDHMAVFNDIRAVVDAAGSAPVKAILEMVLLNDYQKVAGCLLAERAGAAFVKTSTGFAGGGARVEDVAFMKRVVDNRVGIKAAGGIKDFQTARAMLAAGADCLGCSASVAIVT